MLWEDVLRVLKQQGHELGTEVVNSDGRFCRPVDGVMMFRTDMRDLARGVPLDQIVRRNKGKNLPAF
jgi:hypothetical protein